MNYSVPLKAGLKAGQSIWRVLSANISLPAMFPASCGMREGSPQNGEVFIFRNKNNFMRKKLIILLLSLILSLPFWWGINILAKEVEDFYFLKEITAKPEIFSAQASQQVLIEQLKTLRKERNRKESFKNLKIFAKGAVSMEIDKQGKEKILFERNFQTPLPIASLTKLMTALVVFDLKGSYRLSQIIKISKEAVAQEGDSKWEDLKEGEELSVENLLYMTLIESSNDAAFALTEPIGEKGFVDLMNINVKNIGLKNTQFFNPTGLEPDDPANPINHSTVEDLVGLSKYILEKYPQIFEITSHQSYSVLEPNGALHHFIHESTNELLGKIPGILGGKTGWSPRASGCLLLIIKNSQENDYFINIVLGSENRFGDMEKIIDALNCD